MLVFEGCSEPISFGSLLFRTLLTTAIHGPCNNEHIYAPKWQVGHLSEGVPLGDITGKVESQACGVMWFRVRVIFLVPSRE